MLGFNYYLTQNFDFTRVPNFRQNIGYESPVSETGFHDWTPKKETLDTLLNFWLFEYSLILLKRFHIFDQTPFTRELLVRKTFRNSNMHYNQFEFLNRGLMSQRRNSALIIQRNKEM